MKDNVPFVQILVALILTMVSNTAFAGTAHITARDPGFWETSSLVFAEVEAQSKEQLHLVIDIKATLAGSLDPAANSRVVLRFPRNGSAGVNGWALDPPPYAKGDLLLVVLRRRDGILEIPWAEISFMRFAEPVVKVMGFSDPIVVEAIRKSHEQRQWAIDHAEELKRFIQVREPG